jgi:hypothetical protein
MGIPLQALASGGVGDKDGEESNADGNHPKVEHDG